MGLITGIMGIVFGNGRNLLTETAALDESTGESLQKYATDLIHARQGFFDRLVDALNRLPRPMLALGTIWLFVLAMIDPDSFAAGMTGLALVPEPLWWLMGAIVSFYFGARHQAKEQDFQRVLAAAAVASRPVAPPEPAAVADDNPALTDWLRADGK
jgi:hypothetical protein